MRIDRFLSDNAVATRREAAAVARRGGVTVNGVAVRDLSRHIDPERDTVVYLGCPVSHAPHLYVMLNKPAGYVSATEDGKLPTVLDLLSPEHRRRGLFPVGRLDRDTLGLMILTDDGPLAHELLSPRHHVEKVYGFRLAEPLVPGAEERFRDRVVLADGYECLPALLTCDPDRMGGRVTLTEGKYHQIKRMMAALGNRVTRLERLSFGGVTLDATLPAGGWRDLTAAELAALRAPRDKI